MTSSIIENSDYFRWLCDEAGLFKGGMWVYTELIKSLFHKEYTYSFYSDKNRAMAGILLRAHYAQEEGIFVDDVYPGGLDSPCTVLEMLLAIARRLKFDVGRTTPEWFWELISNLELDRFDDLSFAINCVNDILDKWMNHQYELNGKGSIFPMGDDFTGNTQVMGVWEQMNLYLQRKYPRNNWLE